MAPSLARAGSLLLEAPRSAELAYCLLRDPRVPGPAKVALAAAVGILVSPADLPAWIPLLGQLDALALGILAVKVFIEACPEELVREHRAAIRGRRSTFDRDIESSWTGVRAGFARLLEWGGPALPRPNVLEDRSA